jgi:hypothetical protein
MDNDALQGLTVEEAVAHLSAITSRTSTPLRLVVPYEPGPVLIGAKPAVPILNFAMGTDWDHGKVFANTIHKIRGPVVDLEKEQQLMRRAVNAIGAIAMHMRNDRISQEEKLRLVSETISRFNSKSEPTVPAVPSDEQ